MLLDTSVLVDVQRGHKPALDWIEKNERKPLSISAATVFELSVGADRNSDAGLLRRFLEAFVVIAVDAPIAWKAGEYRRRYGRSHGVGQIDALIAATALIAQLPLITLNTRHFPDLPDIRRPYPA